MATLSLVLLVGTAIVGALLLQRLLQLLFPRRRGLHLPPGPRGWPVLGNLTQLGRDPRRMLAALSRKHGPLLSLRLGSVQAVVASSGATAAAFLKTHDAKFCSRPPSAFAEHLGYNYRDIGFAPYGPLWRELRKICSIHLFSAKAVDKFRHIREEETKELARALLSPGESGGGGVVDLTEEVDLCAGNTMTRALTGRRLYGGATGRELELKQILAETVQLFGTLHVADFVPSLWWFDPQNLVSRMKSLHRRFDAMMNRIIEEHEAMGSPDGSNIVGDDLLSVVMAMRGHPLGEDDGAISDTEIKALFLGLFIGGADTTTSAVAWAMAELIRQPKMLKAAQEEMDAVVGRGRLVSDADLGSLPFLQAVVKEVLRLHPPGPLSLPRLAAESCEIGGYHVPKGTTLLVNIWAIARDPEVWPSPLDFRPERFLPGGDHEHTDMNGMDFNFIPFSAGRRSCPARSLAQRMVQFVTAMLVHAFDWELPPGETPETLNMEEIYGNPPRRAVPLRVHPVPRLHRDAYQSS